MTTGFKLQAPFTTFTEADGTPVDGGELFVGVVSENPETAPIAIFWDEALTIPAPNPLSIWGGYPCRNGAPAKVFVAGDHSLTLRNANGELVYSSLSESAGTEAGVLLAANNLSDVGSASTARTNLSVPSSAEMAAAIAAATATIGVPTGFLGFFAVSTAPAGWLECDGGAISRTTYAALFNIIGTLYGSGDGSTTFNLPDFRACVPRGWDHGRGVDSGRVFGSEQQDAIQNITGTAGIVSGGMSGTGAFSANGAASNHIAAVVSGTDMRLTFDASRVARTAGETRVRNIAMLPIIKT